MMAAQCIRPTAARNMHAFTLLQWLEYTMMAAQCIRPTAAGNMHTVARGLSI